MLILWHLARLDHHKNNKGKCNNSRKSRYKNCKNQLVEKIYIFFFAKHSTCSSFKPAADTLPRFFLAMSSCSCSNLCCSRESFVPPPMMYWCGRSSVGVLLSRTARALLNTSAACKIHVCHNQSLDSCFQSLEHTAIYRSVSSWR